MKGEVVYLHAFDVANEIVMSKVREVLGRQPFSYEIRLEHTYPRDIPLYRPLAVEPEPLGARFAGQPVRLLIRIYDVGVVTVAMRISFEVDQVADLMRYHDPVLENGQSLVKVAQNICADVCRGLQDALVSSSALSEPEAYTVFCLTDLGGTTEVLPWLAATRSDVAGLLSQTDPARLADPQVGEVLRHTLSFEKSDLVVIDWDAALLADLSGYVEDVLYVLELANLQLEEFHLMDRTLDRYLNRAYDDLEKQRSFFGTENAVLRSLRRFRVDVAKLTDEVTHITKFLGDWYLARVYLAARERFHIDQWQASVDRRMAQLDQLYSVFHSEINERRMLWLEIIIVVFFAIDLIMLFLNHGK